MNKLAKLWRFIAMQLHKMQTRLLHDIVNEISLLIDEHTHAVSRRDRFIESARFITFIIHRRENHGYLLRRYITVARLIEDKTQHIRTRIYRGSQRFRCTQAANLDLRALVGT